MDVLPRLLSEEAAIAIPLDLFSRLGNCATDVILTEVQTYLKDEKAQEAVKIHVRKAFQFALSLYDGKSDYERREDIRKLADVTLDDISPNVPIVKLQDWHDRLSEILNDEGATPFTAPRSGKVFDEVFEDLKSLASTGKPELKKFVQTLSRNKKYFRDPPRKGFTGTAYKPILTNRIGYENVVTGCAWLIKKLQSGKNPASWRFL